MCPQEFGNMMYDFQKLRLALQAVTGSNSQAWREGLLVESMARPRSVRPRGHGCLCQLQGPVGRSLALSGCRYTQAKERKKEVGEWVPCPHQGWKRPTGAPLAWHW